MIEVLDYASIFAKDIIQQKIVPSDIQWKYCIIFGHLNELSIAMNILADAGWKAINCWNDESTFYTLMNHK